MSLNFVKLSRLLSFLVALILAGALWAGDEAKPTTASKPATASAPAASGPRWAILGRAAETRISAAKFGIASLGNALKMFEIDCGRYPTTAEGLQALIKKPEKSAGWKGPYLEEKFDLKDPWGNPFVYRSPSKIDPDGYDLISCGPDGQEGTSDDISNRGK